MLGHVGKFGGVGWYNVWYNVGWYIVSLVQCSAGQLSTTSLLAPPVLGGDLPGWVKHVGATHFVKHTLCNILCAARWVKHVGATHSVRLRTQIVVVASVESDSHVAVEPTTKATC